MRYIDYNYDRLLGIDSRKLIWPRILQKLQTTVHTQIYVHMVG